MTDTRLTIAEFCAKHDIGNRHKQVNRNPQMDNDEWAKTASHYLAILYRPRKDKKGWHRFSTYFNMGSALTDPPTAEEVLSSLASDASAVENADSFEEWASELGLDTDSRKAEASYRACVEQSAKLRAFLGDEAYNELLWETEGL